ncbi:hypothetical protein [Burkholderia sp. SRS-W-2-2016]|uniref:hypothetical protein n=1 Tax=Burkholderia sp. SRS-W-2-2016 TaxID=1926878 RepID=UPI0015C134FC|nr:hypothetical protein [Burkholderia sp. SRS-W-2-2016]
MGIDFVEHWSMPNEEGGNNHIVRGPNSANTYSYALTVRDSIVAARRPVITGQYRDIETGLWTVFIRVLAEPLQ